MKNFSATKRQNQAIKAAAKIAASHSIKFHTPIILEDSNNTVIHLAPSSIVAKVSTSKFQKQEISNLKHELNVALHLIEHDAPIVPPSSEIPLAVYLYKNIEITFWQYCAGEIREELDRVKLITAIQQFQTALSGYQGNLRLFTEIYQECYSLLNGDCLSPELSKSDRKFLVEIYKHLNARLHSFNYECIPVHTEIHNRNVIWQDNKPLLIDFESCCLGPKELDLLIFSEKSPSICSNIDINRGLLQVLSLFKSFCVAIYCYSQLDRSLKVREAAKYHLNRLYSTDCLK